MIPNVLSIAGVDPSGGAGVLADIKTFSAQGAYGMGVVTALTAQNTQAVNAVQVVSPALVRAQLDTLFADVTVDAIKTGMLGDAGVVQAVGESLAAHAKGMKAAPPAAAAAAGTSVSRHLVVDPVMVAKSGDDLLSRAALAPLLELLLPLATVLTPNLPEAGALLRRRAPENLREMRAAAERLRRLLGDDGQRWVLVKGGHLPGDPIDLLHDGDRMIELPAVRVATKNTHGTGCTLSAAIAALLPQRPDAVAAVTEARTYLLGAIARADQLQVGLGHGPLHHFYRLWGRS